MTTKDDVIRVCWRMQQTLNLTQIELQNKIKEFEETQIQKRHFLVDNRRYWFRKIVNLMTDGLTYYQSVQLLCEEENLDCETIKKTLAAFDCQRKATQNYAQIFAIKKLKKSGFTLKKIANILDLSASTVSRLLKTA